MTDDTFEIGDKVELICRDGARFKGWIDDWTTQYVVVDGRGFPNEDIVCLEHA
jgi:hypothetical protein